MDRNTRNGIQARKDSQRWNVESLCKTIRDFCDSTDERKHPDGRVDRRTRKRDRSNSSNSRLSKCDKKMCTDRDISPSILSTGNSDDDRRTQRIYEISKKETVRPIQEGNSSRSGSDVDANSSDEQNPRRNIRLSRLEQFRLRMERDKITKRPASGEHQPKPMAKHDHRRRRTSSDVLQRTKRQSRSPKCRGEGSDYYPENYRDRTPSPDKRIETDEEEISMAKKPTWPQLDQINEEQRTHYSNCRPADSEKYQRFFTICVSGTIDIENYVKRGTHKPTEWVYIKHNYPTEFWPKGHYHIIFTSTTTSQHNRKRTATRIATNLGIGGKELANCIAGIKTIWDIGGYLYYLFRVSNRGLHSSNMQSAHLANYLMMKFLEKYPDLTKVERLEKCFQYKENRDLAISQKQAKKEDNEAKKINKCERLKDLIIEYDLNVEQDINEVLPEEIHEELLSTWGMCWYQQLRHQIDIRRIARCKRIKQTPFLQRYLEKTTEDERDDEGALWLEDMLKANNINPTKFIAEWVCARDEIIPRRRALFLRGPAGTGKSLWAKLLTAFEVCTPLDRRSDASQFYLEEIVHDTVAWFEEIRINDTNVDTYKLLFEGHEIAVDVKNHKKQIMRGISTICTTNHNHELTLNYYDVQPLRQRMYLHVLNKIVGEKDIKMPPHRITPISLGTLIRNNLADIFKEIERMKTVGYRPSQQ